MNGSASGDAKPGPYEKQFNIAVENYRRNSNGFHPSSTQEKIDGALGSLGSEFAVADAQYDVAEQDLRKSGAVNAKPLNSTLQTLALGKSGLDGTLTAAVIADEGKVRSGAALDQQSLRMVAKRQQETDGVLSSAIDALIASVGTDYGALIAATENPAALVAMLSEQDAAADPDMVKDARTEATKAAEAGLEAVASNPGAFPKPV